MLISGVLAGMATAVGFAALHELLISDIWFSIVPLMVAGALCGGSLAWTYGLLFTPASGRSWAGYIGLQICVLLALGVASLAMFEPVVPIAVLIAANEPPRELIAQAIPLTIVFIALAATFTSVLWGRTLAKFASSLVTSAALIVLLGLNISVLGLVEMSEASFAPIAEFFMLVVVIMAAYGAAFFFLTRRRFFHATGSGPQLTQR